MTSYPITYSVFIGEEKPGETRVMRHPEIGDKPLRDTNEQGTKTIWEGLIHNIRDRGFGNKQFIGTRYKDANGKLGDYYTWKTFNEIHDLSVNFAKGAVLLDLCPEVNIPDEGTFKFLGIYSKNREEWMIADFASHANTVTVVPVYDTLGEAAMEHIFKLTQLSSIVVEAKSLKRLLSLIQKGKHNKVANLIVLDPTDEIETQNKLKELGIRILTMDEVIKKGEGQEITLREPKPDDIATICFTSGTTGLPKGVLITQNNIMCEVSVITAHGFPFQTTDVYLSCLPLAHMMERLIIEVCLTFAIAVGFFSGDPRKLQEDAKILRPTCMCGVPRIYQRVYEKITDEIEKLPFLLKKVTKQAIESKLYELEHNRSITHFFWDKVVLGKIRDILGGRIRFVLTGSAPMEPKVLSTLRVMFSATIFEGYGATENVAGMVLTHATETVPGHLGGPGYANEIKLLDHPELGYTSKDINPETGELEPRGEILLRGPTIFKRYLCNPEATKEAIDADGWLHTGDVAMIIPKMGNALRIIDRVKNMFKLSQGEYIAPEKLEAVLVASRYVGQICIVGNSLESYIVAILVPRNETVIDFFTKKGRTDVTKENVKDFYDDPELKADILKDLETIGRAHDFKGFEVIKKVYMCKEPFSVDNDLLAPTLKNKRHNIQRKYAKEINDLYGRS